MDASKNITQDAPIGSCHFESRSREKCKHDPRVTDSKLMNSWKTFSLL